MALPIAPAMAPPMADRWQSTWQNDAPVARSPFPVVLHLTLISLGDGDQYQIVTSVSRERAAGLDL